MEDSSFQKYSSRHVHFYDEEVSPLLEYGLALTLKSCRKPSVVDLVVAMAGLFLLFIKRFL